MKNLVVLLAWSIAAATAPANASDAPPSNLESESSRSEWADSEPFGLDVEVIQGLALPSKNVTLASPVDGVLMSVLVEEGDRVKQGQVLAVMDDRVSKAAVQAAEVAASRDAEIEHARHALRFTETRLERINSIDDPLAIAAIEREEAESQRDQAKAKLRSAIDNQEQAKRNLALEQARLEALQLRAPFAGRVTQIFEEPGASLTGSEPVLDLVDMDALKAELHLPLTLLGKLDVGKRYTLVGSSPVNQRLVGKLVFIDPVIDAGSQSFRCVFLIDNQNHDLAAGFGVRLASDKPLEARRVANTEGSDNNRHDKPKASSISNSGQ